MPATTPENDQLYLGRLKDFPTEVPVNTIISAFDNPVNWDLVALYAQLAPYSDPPPITGYTGVIDEHDLGGEFMTGEEITGEHIGMQVFYVCNGHHRVTAAIQAGIETLRTIPEAEHNGYRLEELLALADEGALFMVNELRREIDYVEADPNSARFTMLRRVVTALENQIRRELDCARFPALPYSRAD